MYTSRARSYARPLLCWLSCYEHGEQALRPPAMSIRSVNQVCQSGSAALAKSKRSKDRTAYSVITS